MNRADKRRLAIALVLVAVPVILFFTTAPKKAAPVAQVDPASYEIQTIASGLDRPWSVAFVPDGSRLVTEMNGRLLHIAADGKVSAIALDALPPVFRHDGVGQLMEVIIDPAFSRNRLVYLSMGYGEPGANGTRVVRARLEQDRIVDVRILFSSTPKAAPSNNGGRMAFLPDATLVLTVGDGDVRKEAQNPGSHLGKVVRFDRDGKPPADNPFQGRPGVAAEIYSLGHRNAQGIAVDRVSGALLLSEHGPRGGDELNVVQAGKNYGWPVATGGIDYSFARVSPFRRLEGYVDPVLEWSPSIAPAGLAVYEADLFEGWRGDLLVPALKERALRRVMRDQTRIVGEQLWLAELGERMRDVKVAPDGSIYVLTDGTNARLLRLVPAAAAAAPT